MNAGDRDTGHDTALPSGLELRARVVLEEGLTRVDGHTRSRLNQARQAAVAAAAKPSYLAWLHGLVARRALMPAGATAVAVLVAAFVLSGGPHLATPASDNPASSLDVLDLVTDDDAMNLVEDNDDSFYEWAAAQGDSAVQGAGGATT
jgi:hypothetical protein